jgi:tRNA-2-methylthio-N6-dimethylallyladenosine synthase
MKPKFYLLTFGCAMNRNDSERVVSLLLGLGFEETSSPIEADLLVINTCSIRQSAEDRVYGFVKNWQELRTKKPNLIIAITGCMPGRDASGKMRKKITGVDLFFPIEELAQLPSRIKMLNPNLVIGEANDLVNYLLINPERSETQRACVAVQTGCNNFCTYCVVPYARGREHNRTIKEVLYEVKSAVEGGAKEIVLLGQVVNNYRAPDPENFCGDNPFFDKVILAGKVEGKDVELNKDFAALLWEVNQIKGLERLHWTAAAPQYFNDCLIQALTLPKQINYLHLPVQSGDNDILKKMNRHYTREDYINLVKRIRLVRPTIAIGTDIIVGFCGETEEQFTNTLDLYRQCDFDISYHACYSERSGTVAAKAFTDDVPRATKKERWERIQTLMEEITERKNHVFQGQVVSVLVDKCEQGVCMGYSSEMKLVHFVGGEELVGDVVHIKITWTDTWLLRGEVVR